jgi:hypothetical protein
MRLDDLRDAAGAPDVMADSFMPIHSQHVVQLLMHLAYNAANVQLPT